MPRQRVTRGLPRHPHLLERVRGRAEIQLVRFRTGDAGRAELWWGFSVRVAELRPAEHRVVLLTLPQRLDQRWEVRLVHALHGELQPVPGAGLIAGYAGHL